MLADFGAISTWVDNVGHSCLLNHGTGGEPVGTTRRVQVGRNTLVERITEFDAPTSLAYDIEGLPARLGKVANRWTLRPTGATTQVTLTSTLKIGTRPPARLAALTSSPPSWTWVTASPRGAGTSPGRFIHKSRTSAISGIPVHPR